MPTRRRINFAVVLQHPLARGVDVLDLQSSVVNLSPEIAPVTAAAPVIGRDHGVALLHQLAHDVRVLIARHVAVNLPVSQHDEREPPRRGPLPRQERERGDDHLVAARGRRGIVGRAGRRSGETDLVHQRHIAEPLEPEEFIHLPREPGVEVAETLLKRLQPRRSVVGLRATRGGEEQGKGEQAFHPAVQAANRPSRPSW